MHGRIALVVAVLCVNGYVSSDVAAADGLVVDPIVDRIFAELAGRQGLTLVAAPEANDVRIGAIYYVTEPPCADELYRWAGAGKKLKLHAGIGSGEEVGKVRSPNWTTVRIGSLLGREARASISAQAPENSASLSAALSVIDRANAEFSYAIIQSPSVDVKAKAENTLRDYRVVHASQVAGDAVGLIVPHAQLIVQNFAYDARGVTGRRANAAARMLQAVAASLEIGQDKRTEYGFHNPTYAVAAIKPVPMLFKPCAVPMD